MVLVGARCGCSEISKQRVARHSHFTGHPVSLLFTKSLQSLKQSMISPFTAQHLRPSSAKRLLHIMGQSRY